MCVGASAALELHPPSLPSLLIICPFCIVAAHQRSIEPYVTPQTTLPLTDRFAPIQLIQSLPS